MSRLFRPPLARRQFFPPILATFTRAKPAQLHDWDLLRAWNGVPTASIVEDNPDPRVNATRRRVRELREAREA